MTHICLTFVASGLITQECLSGAKLLPVLPELESDTAHCRRRGYKLQDRSPTVASHHPTTGRTVAYLPQECLARYVLIWLISCLEKNNQHLPQEPVNRPGITCPDEALTVCLQLLCVFALPLR